MSLYSQGSTVTGYSSDSRSTHYSAAVISCHSKKYLEDPAEWIRNRADMECPNVADFAVLSLDPVASVGHLDRIAQEAASLLPVRKYVVLTAEYNFHDRLHSYEFYFVRKGLPEPRLSGYDTPESCIAVLPNTHCVNPSHEPVRPAQPLPWDNCYLDATYGFPFDCRVTPITRDYFGVLPVIDSEISRLHKYFRSRWESVRALRLEHGDDWREPSPLDLVNATALLSVSDPDTTFRPVKIVDTRYGEFSGEPSPSLYGESDEISMIASDDDHEPRVQEKSDWQLSYDMRILSEYGPRLPPAKDLRKPVVNVWYDLDMITDIVDPVHFLEDVKRIHTIIDEAEIRLGHRADPTKADQSSLRSSLSLEIADSFAPQALADEHATVSISAKLGGSSTAPDAATSQNRHGKLCLVLHSVTLQCRRVLALARKLVSIHERNSAALLS